MAVTKKARPTFKVRTNELEDLKILQKFLREWCKFFLDSERKDRPLKGSEYFHGSLGTLCHGLEKWGFANKIDISGAHQLMTHFFHAKYKSYTFPFGGVDAWLAEDTNKYHLLKERRNFAVTFSKAGKKKFTIID